MHSASLSLRSSPAQLLTSSSTQRTDSSSSTIHTLKPGVAMLRTPEIDGYIELMRKQSADAHYLENHRGHLMFVKEEEKKFVTAKMIAETSFTATEAEIKKRIEALKAAGYTQFTIQLVPGQEAALADWARIRAAFK